MGERLLDGWKEDGGGWLVEVFSQKVGVGGEGSGGGGRGGGRGDFATSRNVGVQDLEVDTCLGNRELARKTLTFHKVCFNDV